jgi:hypothetical protein
LVLEVQVLVQLEHAPSGSNSSISGSGIKQQLLQQVVVLVEVQ